VESRAKTVARTGPYTFEHFCEMVREDQKADLINGYIYMGSPENTDANELFGWLFSLMTLFVQKKKLGKVYGSRVAFRLDQHNSPEPDIGFVRSDHLNRVERGRVNGPADLAVEIVSPDSVERDYETKRAQYERAGIPEYWIVDEVQQECTLLRLSGKGKYREVRPRKGLYASEALPGFWLRPEWLWQQPLPDILDTLTDILAKEV
jgi:Uma2 family endonuclease